MISVQRCSGGWRCRSQCHGREQRCQPWQDDGHLHACCAEMRRTAGAGMIGVTNTMQVISSVAHCEGHRIS